MGNEERGSGYISLKLQKQLDVVKLIKMLKDFVGRGTSEEGLNTLGLSVKWLDLVEILLRVDGSWDKEPYFYHKYNVTKVKK